MNHLTQSSGEEGIDVRQSTNPEHRMWTRETIDKQNVVERLSPYAVREILSAAPLAKLLPPASFDVSVMQFSALKEQVEEAREKHLDNGRGFVVFEGLDKHFNENVGRAEILAVSKILGTMIAQKQNGEVLREVRYRPEVAAEARRYSDKKEGGDLHTDGAEIPPPLPKYLPLLCVRQAREGGEFIVINSYAVHEQLKHEAPEAAERLSRPIVWDSRDGKNTFEKPVFTIAGNNLTCTYLRSYIDQGYKTAGMKMPADVKAALEAMDKAVENRENQYRIKMQPGQMMVSNNWMTLHGRTSFEDETDDPAKGRLLLRTWVCEKGAVPEGFNPYKK